MTGRHHYHVDVAWTGNTGRGTATHAAYSRDHLISSAGKPAIPGSSDPAFRGDASRWNPEELFLAALSACHELWYLALCAQAGLVVTAYEDHASATLTEHPDGSGEITAVTLRPQVTLAPGSDVRHAEALHYDAHAKCFIARSVTCPVEHRPVTIAQAPSRLLEPSSAAPCRQPSAPRPSLITFDVFGTILDWRTGLESACVAAGRPLRGAEFDRVIDAQAELERGEFADYVEIVRQSLVGVLGLDETRATQIAANLGHFPSYADAPALRDLMDVAPCVAMTNSDRSHGEQVQAGLGFRLDGWVCAQDTRVYKPDAAFWYHVSRHLGIEPGPHWWHVSAYADYDLRVAGQLGLTTVLVDRPHARSGAASHTVPDLSGLLDLLS